MFVKLLFLCASVMTLIAASAVAADASRVTNGSNTGV